MNTNQGDGGPVRGRGTGLTRWVGDLRLGVRLAIGGGRTSKTGVARLVLGTIGIGLAVAVLLVAASAGPMFDARNDRVNALTTMGRSEPLPGADPLYLRQDSGEFRDREIQGRYVHAAGPNAPLPPGVSKPPGDGEILLSQALADLLASPEGELLRPRFPQRVVGIIGQEGVTEAGELAFYAGDDSLDRDNSDPVYAYGGAWSEPMPATLVVLIALGTVVLLVPVFVFIATSARIAGAERDRRLAALRLVGADARQARRIAAAESLVGAVTGLAFGVALFLLFRSLIGNASILGVRPYPGDVTPPWPLVALIVVLVPGIAVLTAQIALRRTIIEPLGVVRRSRPVRRRLWWRLIPVVLGPILLLATGDVSTSRIVWVPQVVTGAALFLIGIPLLLPWVLERVVARIHGGRPAAQLAWRRLQLDSGTPARVVSGVAVVLAGAIALQAVLASQARDYEGAAAAVLPDLSQMPTFMVNTEGEATGTAAETLRSVPGVREVITARHLSVVDTDGNSYTLYVVDCAMLLRYGGVGRCADGEVFVPGQDLDRFEGQRMTLVGHAYRGDERRSDTWTVPEDVRRLDFTASRPEISNFIGQLVATPGALRGLNLPYPRASIAVWAPEDAAEHLRNAVAPYGWRVQIYQTTSWYSYLPDSLQLFLSIQSGLIGGALFILLLAGVSMLVLALEQIRERRRPLAVLAATGVGNGTLARSLLWQNTIPVLIGLAVAVVTGIGLAALVFRLIGKPVTMDWPSVGMFSGFAAALVLLVTVLTLPTLRSATRLAALRSE